MQAETHLIVYHQCDDRSKGGSSRTPALSNARHGIGIAMRSGRPNNATDFRMPGNHPRSHVLSDWASNNTLFALLLLGIRGPSAGSQTTRPAPTCGSNGESVLFSLVHVVELRTSPKGPRMSVTVITVGRIDLAFAPAYRRDLRGLDCHQLCFVGHVSRSVRCCAVHSPIPCVMCTRVRGITGNHGAVRGTEYIWC